MIKGNNLIWLTVDGCPRSGTTILGQILNTHPNIALFHEYDQAKFFSIIDNLFSEEKRLSFFESTIDKRLLPIRDKHQNEIIKAIFKVISNKDVNVVGTKFPGANLWPTPQIPSGVEWKQIIIIRNPLSVISSYLEKMIKDKVAINNKELMFDTAIYHWLSSWNYAVSNQNNKNCLILFYEELSMNSTFEKVSTFLNVENKFNYEAFNTKDKSDDENYQKILKMGFEDFIFKLKAIEDFKNWHVNNKILFTKKQKLGFPLLSKEIISLTSIGNVKNNWKFPIYGFYPRELEGSFIFKEKSEICFVPLFNTKKILFNIDVSHFFMVNGIPPAIQVSINDKIYLEETLIFRNDKRPYRFSFIINMEENLYGKSCVLTLTALNYANPQKCGINPNDDRDLSIMVHGIQITNI